MFDKNPGFTFGVIAAFSIGHRSQYRTLFRYKRGPSEASHLSISPSNGLVLPDMEKWRQSPCGQSRLKLIIIGIAIKIAAAFVFIRLIAGMLLEIKAWDPATYLAALIIIALIALMAVWLPAHARHGSIV